MTPVYLTLLTVLKKVPGGWSLAVSLAHSIIEDSERKNLSNVSPAVYVLVEDHLRGGNRKAANNLVRELISSVRTSTPNQFMRDFGINLNVHQLSAIYDRYDEKLPGNLLELFEQVLNSYELEFSGSIDELSHSELRTLSETLREDHLAPKFRTN